MSPILVRPVREQLEHDRVIRLLQQDLQKRKVEVGINPGAEQNASVGSGTRKEFPDAVVYSLEKGKKVVAVVEVETGESVNHLEAMAQWAHLAKLRVPFHLYVPDQLGRRRQTPEPRLQDLRHGDLVVPPGRRAVQVHPVSPGQRLARRQGRHAASDGVGGDHSRRACRPSRSPVVEEPVARTEPAPSPRPAAKVPGLKTIPARVAAPAPPPVKPAAKAPAARCRGWFRSRRQPRQPSSRQPSRSSRRQSVGRQARRQAAPPRRARRRRSAPAKSAPAGQDCRQGPSLKPPPKSAAKTCRQAGRQDRRDEPRRPSAKADAHRRPRPVAASRRSRPPSRRQAGRPRRPPSPSPSASNACPPCDSRATGAGYESTYLLHSSKRRTGPDQPQLLYWFRSPPHVKVGRAAFDEDAIRVLEEQHPDVEFDWDRILTTKPPAAPESRDPREARPARRPERRPARETRRDTPRPAHRRGRARCRRRPETRPGAAVDATASNCGGLASDLEVPAGVAGRQRRSRPAPHRRSPAQSIGAPTGDSCAFLTLRSGRRRCRAPRQRAVGGRTHARGRAADRPASAACRDPGADLRAGRRPGSSRGPSRAGRVGRSRRLGHRGGRHGGTRRRRCHLARTPSHRRAPPPAAPTAPGRQHPAGAGSAGQHTADDGDWRRSMTADSTSGGRRSRARTSEYGRPGIAGDRPNLQVAPARSRAPGRAILLRCECCSVARLRCCRRWSWPPRRWPRRPRGPGPATQPPRQPIRPSSDPTFRAVHRPGDHRRHRPRRHRPVRRRPHQGRVRRPRGRREAGGGLGAAGARRPHVQPAGAASRRRRRRASSCRRHARPTTPQAASSCSSSTTCT